MSAKISKSTSETIKIEPLMIESCLTPQMKANISLFSEKNVRMYKYGDFLLMSAVFQQILAENWENNVM